MIDIRVRKITTPNDLYDAQDSSAVHRHGLASAYHSENKCIQTQLFKVCLYEALNSTSLRFEQYNTTGQLHYIKSITNDGNLVQHLMYLNARHLIDMSRDLLCNLAYPNITETMRTIQEEIFEIDPALASRMQPDCIYRGGICYKGNDCCGYMPKADINYYKVLTETKGE